MNKILISYYRKNGKPTGCIAAIGVNMVGWSLCSEKDGFKKDLAKRIAIGRALRPGRAMLSFLELEDKPDGFRDLISEMYERSQRYYRD